MSSKFWFIILFFIIYNGTALKVKAVESEELTEIREIRRKVPKKDSLEFLRIFYDLKWKAVIRSEQGTVKQFDRIIPDTITLQQGDLIRLTSHFKVIPGLLNEIFCFHYKLKGSCLIRLNNKVVLTTGYFSGNSPSAEPGKNTNGFKEFVFTDTINVMEIDYFPKLLDHDFIEDLKICQLTYRDSKIKEENEDKLFSFFTGSFHIAFAIIFMIVFMFFKAGRENFYFALYALLVGLIFIFTQFSLPAFFDMFFTLSWILALESLAVFLSRVILNKSRNFVFSIILLLLILGFSIYNQWISTLETRPFLFSFTVFLILGYAIEIISLLYYLVQGFTKKKWEAKTIAIGFLVGLVFIIIFIVAVVIFSEIGNGNKHYLDYISYIPYLSLMTVLVTMSIILGRKNGENQQNLILQLKEIDKLAKENLAREIEKQQLLASQNAVLEDKVNLRTREVMLQKEIIENKNTEITQNLNYAKRIQSAILPGTDIIKKVFPRFFVLYLPKDIVSGDFYTFIPKGEEVLLACADSTGHGVSGAFMSMIGSSLFNQVVIERNMTKPDQVLDQLNREVINFLKQRLSDSNDGMDMTVCRINPNTGMMDFASANRPLWLIRNKTLQEFKPDKFPIGGLQYIQEKKFTLNQLQLQSGDTLYMSTDGFADQFGGEAGKKLMTKKFKELILSVQDMTMEEQETFFHKFFNDWKGDREQVDDVLIIGLRF